VDAENLISKTHPHWEKQQIL